MAGLNSWLQIPSDILDLGKRAEDAKNWADGERAKLAETWGNVQRQQLASMANMWQQHNDATDHFTAGYNDMAGASSGPQAQPDVNYAPPGGAQDLPGTALADVPGQAVNSAVDWAKANNERQSAAFTASRPNTTGKMLGGFTDEQQAAQNSIVGNTVMGLSGGIENEAANVVRGAAGAVADKVAGDVAPAAESVAADWAPKPGGAGMGGAPPEVPAAAAAPGLPGAGSPNPLTGPNLRPSVDGDAFAGNIRLAKFVDPHVQQVIVDSFNRDPSLMETARRGVISDAEVQSLADAAGTSVQKIIAKWKPGDVANAETITAMKRVLDSKSQDVLTAQKAIKAGDNSDGGLLQLQLAVKEQQVVQQAVSGGTAELARGMRALRANVSETLASGDSQKMEDLLNKLGGREFTKEIATKLGQLDQNDPTQVAHFLRDLSKPNVQDYLTEYWYNSILSGPPTHIANTNGNIISSLLVPAERGISAAVEVPMAALAGRPRERFFGEAPAAAYGLLHGLQDGVRAAAYVMQHGFSEESALKGEVKAGQAFKGPVGNVLNIPSRLMGAEDMLFKGVLKSSNQAADIYRMAASEGLKGKMLKARIDELTADVPAAIVAKSGKLADYQLFRSEPDQIAKVMMAVRNITIKGTSLQPMRFVIPFISTPVNLTKFGLERSPVGMAYAVGKTIATKGSAEASDQMARALPASLAAATVGSLVATGAMDITGAAPTDPAKRDAFYRQGKLPFSIRLGNKDGTWHSYQRMEPMNQAFAQIAATIDAVRDAKAGDNPTDIGKRAVFTIAQNIASQTYLQSINGLIQAISDPERYGNQFFQGLAGGMVPMSGAMRTAANVIDPRQRQAGGVMEAVESNIPGMSQNVPARMNNFGEDQMQPGSPVNPYKYQQANDSPLETELARLRVEPGATGKTLRGIDLTRQENADYHRMSGQMVKERLQRAMADPRYAGSSEAQKAKVLQTAIDHAKTAAQKAFLDQMVKNQGKDALKKRVADKKLANAPRVA